MSWRSRKPAASIATTSGARPERWRQSDVLNLASGAATPWRRCAFNGVRAGRRASDDGVTLSLAFIPSFVPSDCRKARQGFRDGQPPSSLSTPARASPRRLGPTPRVADVGHRGFGSAPRPAAAAPGSRERAPAGSETATSSSRGWSRGEPTPHRPYPLNTLRLKAFLQDGLLGKHSPGETSEVMFPLAPYLSVC